MLNNKGKPLENTDIKTLSPLFSLADHSFNEEEEENSVRSGSSSGESSPSDLRKRLQDLPSPNEAARLANRVINVSRRLSRKRDLYFYGTTNRIEENVEREEREEQEEGPQLSRKSFGELKAKDARARRRAKIHFESVKNQAMGVSQPSEDNASRLNNNLNNSGTLATCSVIESTPLEGNSEQLPSSMVETPKNYSQRFSPLSGRTPNTLSPYRNRHSVVDDSSKSQANTSLLSLYSSLSLENSPKDRIELQPLSPVSLSNVRPTKFGGYRTKVSLNLKNLSSSSEMDSSRENSSSRVDFDSKIDRSAVATSVNLTGMSNVSPVSSNKNILNFNDRSPSMPSTARRPSISREDSNSTLHDSSRNEDFVNVRPLSPVSKINLTDGDKLPSLSVRSDARNSNDCSSSTPVSSRGIITRENSFYRFLDTPRSDSGPYTNDNSGKIIDKITFLSVRNDSRSYKKPHLQTHYPSFGTQIHSTCSKFSETPGASEISPYAVTNFDKKTPQKYLKIFHNEEHSQPVIKHPIAPSTPESLPSAKDGLPSPETIFWSSNINTGSPLTATIPEEKEDIARSQFITSASDIHSAALSSKEYFVDEFREKREENDSSQVTTEDDRELFAETDNRDFDDISNRQEYTNVPTLVLNSREASHFASPVAETRSTRCLNADDLIVALSNVSLTQQVTNEARTCSELRGGVVSRPGSSGKNATSDKNSRATSLQRDEIRIKSNASVRSSLSLRSKIPVKIPSDKYKISSNVNKFTEEQRSVNSSTVSIDSNGQTFRSRRLPEVYRPNFEKNDQALSSRDELSSFGSYSAVNFEESVDLATASPADVNSKEPSERFDPRHASNSPQNSSESEISERTLSKDVLSRNDSSSQIQTNSDNRHECEEETQSPTDHGDLGDTERSSINRLNMEDTFRSSNLSDDQKDHRASDRTDSDHTESATISLATPHYCELLSAKEHEEYADNFESRIKSIESTMFVHPYRTKSYRVKYSKPSYEGDVCERITEIIEPNLNLQNRIGDGCCQDAFVEESDKLRFKEEAVILSPETEKTARNGETGDNCVRFSLERMAAEQIRRNIYAEQAKTIQSETVAYITETFYEAPTYSLSHSSSMSKLQHPYDAARDSPRFRKKSQDRFPFTISEKTSAASMKFKAPGRFESLVEDTNSLDRVYKLDMHPSITRLAGCGFEDTTADIIDYVIQNEKEGQARSSGMRGFVQRISARLRKSKKRDKIKLDPKTTNVIYENQAYRGDSVADSCSESSSTKEFKVYESLLETSLEKDDSPDEKSSTIPDKKFPKNHANRTTLNSNLCIRHDRNDLWVQKHEPLDGNRDGDNEMTATPKSTMDKCKSVKDPYSVFFVKSPQETPDTSVRLSLPKDEPKQGTWTERKGRRVKFRSPLVTKVADKNVHKKSMKNRNFENTRSHKNTENGCLCLQFYRMIIPISLTSVSKYHSRVNRSGSSWSIKKKSYLSSKKRKG